MNRNHKTIEDILNRHIRSAPADEMESDAARVLDHIREESAQGRNRIAVRGTVDIAPVRRSRQFARVMAAVFLVVLSFGGVRDFVLNRNAAAFVETADGRVRVALGETLRSGSVSSSLLVLKDGSQIEMRSKSQLALEGAEDGVRIRLDSGSVIVTASKQRTGHLYVQTKDLTASVVGTVFVVKAEQSGSRVAVIEGEVRVDQGPKNRRLLPGEQVATNALVEPHPVSREVSWSRYAETHLARLQRAVAPEAVPPKRLEFEVASIKMERAGGAESLAGSISPQCMGVDGLLNLRNPTGVMAMDLDPNIRPAPPVAAKGRCFSRLTSLAHLIGLAYSVDWFLTSSLGGPEWAHGSPPEGLRFQVEAKAEDPETATKAQLQQMLQAMLAERFKLKVSWQAKEVEGFVVSTGKDGHRLVGALSEEALKYQEVRSGETVQRVITGKASVKDFLDFIGLRPPLISRMGSSDAILNRTDLKGIYAFRLAYTLPPAVPVGDNIGRRGGGAPPSFGQVTPALAAFRDALEEQLGLRLEFAKIPRDIPVIEHVEPPSEN
jgi:uncharacterized protein (TIGR03435 family)